VAVPAAGGGVLVRPLADQRSWFLWGVANETAIVARPCAGPPEGAVSEGCIPPDILEDLGGSLSRSGRARPRERRSLRSAQEALPSVGGWFTTRHGSGACDGSARLMGTADLYAPMGIYESAGSR
jgi:hypothetical protein